MAWGMSPQEAASISIVGGADGPMVLFTSLKLAPTLLVPIAVVAYMYLALCYVGYPYIIKWLIPKNIQGTQWMSPLFHKFTRRKKSLLP